MNKRVNDKKTNNIVKSIYLIHKVFISSLEKYIYKLLSKNINDFIIWLYYYIYKRRKYMKKIGIVTIYDLRNYGNRLQNYATQSFLKKMGFEVYTIVNNDVIEKMTISIKLKRFILKMINSNIRFFIKKQDKRMNNFKIFDSLIDKKYVNNKNINKIKKQYDYFVVGSDQVWNPYYCPNSDWYFLNFCDKSQKLTMSPSIGLNILPKEYYSIFKEKLKSFDLISCREFEGTSILEDITKKDVITLIDPTMLLTTDEWDTVIKKPKKFISCKYVLLYFLGGIDEKNTKYIKELKEAGYQIIDLLDINNDYYECNPSEFVWLIKNASLMVTDSFHGCVFSILYKTPFVSIDRISEKKFEMNSRINTLMKKFNLERRVFNDNKSVLEYMEQDFSNIDMILKEEREKFKAFFQSCIKK